MAGSEWWGDDLVKVEASPRRCDLDPSTGIVAKRFTGVSVTDLSSHGYDFFYQAIEHRAVTAMHVSQAFLLACSFFTGRVVAGNYVQINAAESPRSKRLVYISIAAPHLAVILRSEYSINHSVARSSSRGVHL